MPQSQLASKIWRFLGLSPAKFNPFYNAYKILFGGIVLLCFSFWNSYDKYQHGEFKKISIENVSPEYVHTINTGGKSIEVSQKSELLLKPQSYGQQLIFDLDPDSNNLFSLYITSFIFVISLAMFIVLKNIPKDFTFSKNVATSLTKLHVLVYIIIIIRVLVFFLYYAYIRDLLNPEFHLQKTVNTYIIITLATYGLFATSLSVVINFFNQGLRLQEEQDLTV